MTNSDDGTFDDDPLSAEESLDDEETGFDPEEGYSPPERPQGVTAWGVTEREAEELEDVERRTAEEEPEVYDVEDDGDGIGDATDTDGEPIDDQVGDARSGRLVVDDIEESDLEDDGEDDLEDDEDADSRNLWARDVGVDGAGASAEEAAIHVVPDPDDS